MVRADMHGRNTVKCVHVTATASQRPVMHPALAYSVRDPILKLLVADGIGGNGLRTTFYRNGERGYRIQIFARVLP